MINWQMFSVFLLVFIVVTIMGLLASRWRRGDLNRLQEWGLAGRRFGTTMSWFLLGGEIYTAYTFIALPGNIFAQGAAGFFSIPYVILCYPIFFLVLPKLWTVARHRGYVTPADFVRERFGSSSLALAVALTGILATMPYIALQMYGIEIVIAQMGVPLDIVIMGVHVDITLFIAFLIMAAYTYNSGLRAPAMMALVKDLMLCSLCWWRSSISRSNWAASVTFSPPSLRRSSSCSPSNTRHTRRWLLARRWRYSSIPIASRASSAPIAAKPFSAMPPSFPPIVSCLALSPCWAIWQSRQALKHRPFTKPMQPSPFSSPACSPTGSWALAWRPSLSARLYPRPLCQSRRRTFLRVTSTKSISARHALIARRPTLPSSPLSA